MDIIQMFGLLTILLFYGSYFVKQLLLRRQGISTDRLGRGEKPTRTLIIEVILKISTFTMAAVQLISLIVNKRWYLLNANKNIRYIGIGMALLGIFVFVIAMITMRNNWRAGVDFSQKTKLIQHGIYKISRNPAFLGFDLFYLGFTLAFSNPIQLAFLIICVLMLHLQIREEEKFLPGVFGKEYIEYMGSTGRYFIF